MSIKSDNWIRRMAHDHGMIEPFAAEQVRHVEGRKIVSYGTSSYGYDVRCAGEFKIFTNINSTIVDPKQFDEKSFVDLSAEVCIIPPNSFALARTVEFFRIPRSVLTVCLGKCLTEDTRVVDADTGDYLPISQMRFGRRTLAMDGWELRPAPVSAVMAQGRKPVFELRTRAGLRIKATANHPFRQFYGWTALEQLKPGDRIAIARSIPVFGRTPLPRWEAHLLGLMISEGQCCTPGHSPTFTSEDPVLVAMLQKSVLDGGLGQVSHNGRLGYRIVNRIGRGGIAAPNRATLWLKKHGLAVGAAEKFVPACVFRAPRADVRAFLQALFAGDGGLYRSGEGVFLEYYSKSRRLIEDVHHLLLRFGIFGLIREKTTSIGTRACSILVTDIEQIQRFDREVGFVAGCIKQRRLEEYRAQLSTQGRRRSNFDTLPNESLLQLQLSASGAGRTLNSIGVSHPGSQSVSLKALARIIEATRDPEISGLATGPVWDVVSEIVPAGVEETYDISVPWLHNFVANDMLVHNSTYARCFSGDTRVALVDGGAATLEQMARRHASGELFWGYSIGSNGRLIISLLEAPRLIGRDCLIELTLDSGARIRATPDHLFMRRNGRMAECHTLRTGDSLMPLYRDAARGYEVVYQPLDGHMYATHGLAAAVNCDRTLFRRFPEVIAPFRATPAYRNHKVAAIREVPGHHDVYCLSVPEAGNFALEAGVFVHNCGIIVNVTPLEPEWEGHVTLEFSNTTPLPAKIYANEGVAQMLFFESDEVCSTSYRDRGGKYMGQLGVTLPKT